MPAWSSCAFQSIERQDQLVLTLLGGVVANLGARCRVWDNPPTGRCACKAPSSLVGPNHTIVEMGANDGLHMSNSYFFSKTLGWRALLVEGNPEVYKRIGTHRPEAERVNALVGNPKSFPNGKAPFYSFYRPGDSEKANTALDWETGLSGIPFPNSSTVALRSLAHAKRAAARYGIAFKEHQLDVVRFSALLDDMFIDKIDVLFLDVEGAELSVLQTLNFKTHPVRILVVERPSQDVSKLLAARGYHDLRLTYDSGGDRVFVKSTV